MWVGRCVCCRAASGLEGAAHSEHRLPRLPEWGWSAGHTAPVGSALLTHRCDYTHSSLQDSSCVNTHKHKRWFIPKWQENDDLHYLTYTLHGFYWQHSVILSGTLSWNSAVCVVMLWLSFVLKKNPGKDPSALSFFRKEPIFIQRKRTLDLFHKVEHKLNPETDHTLKVNLGQASGTSLWAPLLFLSEHSNVSGEHFKL